MSNDHRKKSSQRYRSDGSKVASRVKVEGPGIWVTCVKGKEKQTVGELYDLFESIAEELYPEDVLAGGDDDEDDEDDLEKALQKELQALKKPKKEGRFVNCRTDTTCAVFIRCRPPIDPIRIVKAYIEEVDRTGASRTRHALRFSPVSGSCPTGIQEIVELTKKLVPTIFQAEPARAYTYRIQLNTRNHNKLDRDEVIREIANCVPKDGGHAVNLKNAEVVILVELFASVCGISIVTDYDRLKRFNPAQIVEAARRNEMEAADHIQSGTANVPGPQSNAQ